MFGLSPFYILTFPEIFISSIICVLDQKSEKCILFTPVSIQTRGTCVRGYIFHVFLIIAFKKKSNGPGHCIVL